MTTFVLVHGGGHQSWHWRFLRPLLEERGHATLAPEVPMHVVGAGSGEWADAVLAALAEAGSPQDVIAVGHSLGGLALPIVASRYHLKRMVFVCANVPLPGVSYAQYLQANPDAVIMPPVVLDDLGRVELSWPDARRLYYGDCEESVARGAWERLLPSAALTAFTEPCPLKEWPTVPADYILCQEDRIVGPSWSRKVAQERLGTQAIELPGGHSPMLSRPEELANLLDSVAVGTSELSAH